jgi:hypothetical protein
MNLHPIAGQRSYSRRLLIPALEISSDGASVLTHLELLVATHPAFALPQLALFHLLRHLLPVSPPATPWPLPAHAPLPTLLRVQGARRPLVLLSCARRSCPTLRSPHPTTSLSSSVATPAYAPTTPSSTRLSTPTDSPKRAHSLPPFPTASGTASPQPPEQQYHYASPFHPRGR